MSTTEAVVSHAQRFHQRATAPDMKGLALSQRILEREWANAVFLHPEFRPHRQAWMAAAKGGR